MRVAWQWCLANAPVNDRDCDSIVEVELRFGSPMLLRARLAVARKTVTLRAAIGQ